jgi:molybdopterin-guanine dinucleotide biosynthesis protein B
LGVINTLNLKDYGVDNIGKIELIIPDANSKQTPKECLSEIEINNKPLMINSFTNDIVTNSIKAMINSLKTEEEVERIEILISNINPDDLKISDISVEINGINLEINEFTQGILKETIYAIVNSLKINDEIKEIKIKVEE